MPDDETISQEALQGHIQNPLELDGIIRALERRLQFTSSPLRKFLLISETFEQIRHLPQEWLSSYIHAYAGFFPKLIQHPDITCLSPSIWKAAVGLLRFIDEHGWLKSDAEKKEAFATAYDKAVFSFACVGAVGDLHDFLRANIPDLSPLSKDALNRILSVGSDEHSMFMAYMEEVQSPRQAVDALGAARTRWDQFLDQQNAVSIALLEDDGANAIPSQFVAGRILSLEIRRQKAGLAIQIENALDVDGSEMLSQLRIAQQVASSFLRERLHADTISSHRFRIPHAATIVGRSLALSSAVGMVCFSSEELNSRIRWSMNPDVLCIGSLTANGVVEESPLPVLLKKIQLAFFSPLRKVVIHTQQCVHALNEVQRLKALYPHRTLEVIGISSITECFDRQGIVDVQIRSSFDRVKHVVKRHALVITGIVAVILLLLAGYLWYKANYIYPNLEHALGIKIGSNAIVYNPRDSLEWCFRDGAEVKEPVIPFGDIEIGDGFTRNFWIWNMTPRQRNVEIVVEGRDAPDWYINWRGGKQTLPDTEPFEFSVMFAPLTGGPEKTATMLLRDPETKEVLYRLRLTGSAGAPTAGGYAIRLDGVDDMLYFGKNAPTFTSAEGTFECWVRPAESRNQTILYNGSNFRGASDFQNMSVWMQGEDTLGVLVGNFREIIDLSPAQRLAVGKWFHIALSYSITKEKVAVFVNGIPVLQRSSRFFIEGLLSPHVTIGCRYDGEWKTGFFNGDIDEIRVWRTMRSPEEIQQEMRRVISGATHGLVGYWNFDTDNETTAFTGTDRAEKGELLYRPALVRSSVPVMDDQSTAVSVAQDAQGIVLAPFTYLQSARNPLPQFTDATYALWFKAVPTDTVSYFAIVNNGHFFELHGTGAALGTNGYPFQISRDGWNHFVLRADRNGKTEMYLNGVLVVRDTLPTEFADRNHRYEGIQLGFSNDKFNHFGAKHYPWKHESLTRSREFRSLAVYSRLLTDKEVKDMVGRENGSQTGLVAVWEFDGEPDQEGNYVDRVAGMLMHVKWVRVWE